jgi:two-component system chemotaxis response regulator CheB
VSSHTRRSSQATIRALQLGACDFVAKPAGSIDEGYRGLRAELVEKLAAAGSRQRQAAASEPHRAARSLRGRKPRIIVVGSSTGGAAVLTGIVNALPRAMEATVVAVQHMPAGFTAEFARNLSRTARCAVREARDGELVAPSTVFVAPGGLQCTVYGNCFRIRAAAAAGGSLPSIDVTMQSVARRFGPDVCGVLLSGMGRDGAHGISAIRDSGGCTVVQDESTSVVFGMPKAALATGKVDAVLTDEEIRREIALLASG